MTHVSRPSGQNDRASRSTFKRLRRPPHAHAHAHAPATTPSSILHSSTSTALSIALQTSSPPPVAGTPPSYLGTPSTP
eukprot:362142-Chlamydomonas_euryale.AAC.7